MLSHAPKSGSRLNPHSFVFGSHPERRTVRSAPKHAENSGEQRTRVGISVPAVPSGVNPKSGLRHEARVRSVTPIGLRERPTVRNAPKNAENSAEPSAHVERALAELASAERSGASRLCEKGLERRSAKLIGVLADRPRFAEGTRVPPLGGHGRRANASLGGRWGDALPLLVPVPGAHRPRVRAEPRAPCRRDHENEGRSHCYVQGVSFRWQRPRAVLLVELRRSARVELFA